MLSLGIVQLWEGRSLQGQQGPRCRSMRLHTINDTVNTAQLREATPSDSRSWFIRPGPSNFLLHQVWGSPSSRKMVPHTSISGRDPASSHSCLQPPGNLWEETEAQGGGWTHPSPWWKARLGSNTRLVLLEMVNWMAQSRVPLWNLRLLGGKPWKCIQPKSLAFWKRKGLRMIHRIRIKV